VTGGGGFSYDFKVLSVGENHPFSFSGLPTGRPSQAQWLAQRAATLASVVGSKERRATSFWANKAAVYLSHDCSVDSDSRRDFLALADAEHLCTAAWTDALGGGSTVLHGNGFGIFHFLLGPALNTICLHVSSSIAILQAE